MALPRTLTEGLVPLVTRNWSDSDRAEAAMRVLDWAGCVSGGRSFGPGAGFAAAGPTGDDPETAAFRLGSFGSLLEMDDVHKGGLLHPGPVIIPAALALARDADGPHLLNAIIGGYEAMIRLGRSIGKKHYALFHNTSTCGGMGAAVAASIMLGLDGTRMVHAMGHAMSLAGGLWQCRNEPGVTKHLHVAEAARRGVMAARAAGAGLVAPRAILEGPQGLFAAMAPDASPDLVLTDPGGPALIHETSYKPWPACRHAHPAIDALLALRPEIRGRAIRSVELRSFGDALLFCDRPEPADSLGARFSLQHAAAVVLADGLPGLDAFDTEALALPRYTALRPRVHVVEDPEMTAAYPAHFGAAATVTLEDATELTAEVPDALGDPENPVTPDQIQAKFTALITWAGLTERDGDALSGEIRGLTMPGSLAGGLRNRMLAMLKRAEG